MATKKQNVNSNFHKGTPQGWKSSLAAALGAVQALTRDDAAACLDATLVEGIVGLFADRLSTMVATEQSIIPQPEVLRDGDY